MRRFAACCLLALVSMLALGCGGASGIQEGIPKNTELPKDFDPGGSAKPDMTGRAVPPKA